MMTLFYKIMIHKWNNLSIYLSIYYIKSHKNLVYLLKALLD